MIIGLTGAKRSGKDTVGTFLVNNHGFVRVSLADNIRKVAYNLDPYIQAGTRLLAVGTFRLAAYVDEFGWEVAKDQPDVRRLLQRLGTEAVVDIFGPDIWTNLIAAQITELGDRNVVVTDIRKHFEADFIHQIGGFVWMIERPNGDVSLDTHVTEQEWMTLDYDAVISNRYDLDSLEKSVNAMLERFSPGDYA